MEDAWENRIGNRVTRTVLGETKDVITLIVQHPADVNLLISTQNQIGKSNFSSRVVQKCLFSVWLFFLFVSMLEKIVNCFSVSIQTTKCLDIKKKIPGNCVRSR